MKDILLKTTERKKEILLSAGTGNVYGPSSGEKDISGFTETAHAAGHAQQESANGGLYNSEDPEVAHNVKSLQRQISNVSPSEISGQYALQRRPQQMEILARRQVVGRVSHTEAGAQKITSEKQRE